MPSPLTVVSPWDRRPIAEVPTDDPAGLEDKIATAARLARDLGATLPVYERIAVLEGAAERVAGAGAAFARRIALEGGKPMVDAEVEVGRAIASLRTAARALADLHGEEVPLGATPAGAGRLAFTTREPIGAVAAISAFNHPLNLIAHQVAPAVAAGCPIVIKPASATPLSCLALVTALREAGLPDAWCQTFVTSDNRLAEAMATDARVAFLSFIGSAKVGWSLRSKLAAGCRCALEHGGAAPVIVDSSADLEATVASLLKGGFYHAGQVCVSVQRIFAHRDIAARLVEGLVAGAAALSVGDPLLSTTQVGPLIHPREVSRVEAWVEEARTGGARVAGGGRLGDTALSPAIVVDPPAMAKISREEIFGPAVAVFSYDHLDEAIARANSLPLAFQASVFAEALAPALRAAERLRASCVLVNDHTAFRTDNMPFAGLGASGYGIGGIVHSLREMTHEKMVVLRRT